MAEVIRAEACCGLRELDGLSQHSDPVAAMKDITMQIYGELRPKATGKEVNPYKKPKDKQWENTSSWSGRFWTRDDGMIVYEYQAEDWEYDRSCNDGGGDVDKKWRYAVFTQAGKKRTYGKKFAALIRRENLGEVMQATTKSVKNPNSGNILKAWIWTVNHKNLKAWAQKQANIAAGVK